MHPDKLDIRQVHAALSPVVCQVRLHNGATPARPCQRTGAGKRLSRRHSCAAGSVTISHHASRNGKRGGHSNVILKSGWVSLNLPEKQKKQALLNVYPREPNAPRAEPPPPPRARRACTLLASLASTPPIRPPSDSSHGAGEQTASSGLSLPPPDDYFSWRATATVPGSASPS
jgi:hypothetical protein